MSIVATYRRRSESDRCFTKMPVENCVGWHSEALRAIAGMFVAIFEGELGDAGFVEIARGLR